MLKLPRRSQKSTIVIDGMSPLLDNQTPTVHYSPAREYTREQLEEAARRAVVASSEVVDAALSPKKLAHAPLREFGFTASSALGGALWHSGADYLLYVKGLPEKILTRCDLTENEREAALLQLQKLSGEGNIVVAIAKVTLPKPITTRAAFDKQTFAFVGFASFACRTDSTVQRLVRIAVKKGISVHFITGAHTQAAFAVGYDLKLVQRSSEVCDARQLHLTDQELQTATVFARAQPQEKKAIIAAIESHDDNVIVISTKQQLIDTLSSRG